jgi:hypothetical protein
MAPASLDAFVGPPADVGFNANRTIVPKLDHSEVFGVGYRETWEAVSLAPVSNRPSRNSSLGRATYPCRENAHLDSLVEPALHTLEHCWHRRADFLGALPPMMLRECSVEIDAYPAARTGGWLLF